MSSWLTLNQKSSPVVDKFEVLQHIEKCSPRLSSDARKSVLNEVETEVRSWSPYKRQAKSFKVDVQLLVEQLCREARGRSLNSLELRMKAARDGYERPLSRRDILRFTADAELSFDAKLDRRNAKGEPDPCGEVTLVDISHLTKGQFLFARFDTAFVSADLKRLWKRLTLRGGHLHCSTFKEVGQSGERRPRTVPLAALVACRKYETAEYNSVWGTAHCVDGNVLNLTAANIVIPALNDSDATREANKKFNKGLVLVGGATNSLLGRFSVDELFYGKPKSVPVSIDTKNPAFGKSQSQALTDAYAELSKLEAAKGGEAESEEVVTHALAKQKGGE